MSSALIFFLLLVSIFESVDFVSLEGPHNDFGFYKALAAPSTSSSPSTLVSSSHWGGAFEFPSAAQTGISSFKTSFEGRGLAQSYRHSHEELQCSMEVHSLSATSQAQCHALSYVPCSLADSHGPHLCTWSEAESTELGRLPYWEFLSPGVSVVPPEITEPETENSEPSWQKVSTQQGRRQRLRPVQLCPIPAVPAWTLSTTSSTDGTAIATAIDTATMDAKSGTYGPYDAYTHAASANGKQCSDASANAHACTYVAAQCTGPGTEGTHCLPPEALCRPSSRHPAEGAQYLQKGRKKSHQGPRDGSQGPWRGAHGVRRGTLGALTAYQHLEGIFGRSGQELVRLWQALRTTRRSIASMAKEQFQDAKDCMEASNISVGKVVVQELSDEEDLPGDAGASAMQITESIQSLSTSLQQLSKATESIQIEEKAAKRPRLDASKSEAEAASHFS